MRGKNALQRIGSLAPRTVCGKSDTWEDECINCPGVGSDTDAYLQTFKGVWSAIKRAAAVTSGEKKGGKKFYLLTMNKQLASAVKYPQVATSVSLSHRCDPWQAGAAAANNSCMSLRGERRKGTKATATAPHAKKYILPAVGGRGGRGEQHLTPESHHWKLCGGVWMKDPLSGPSEPDASWPKPDELGCRSVDECVCVWHYGRRLDPADCILTFVNTSHMLPARRRSCTTYRR